MTGRLGHLRGGATSWLADDPGHGPNDFRIRTFSRIERTEAWRRRAPDLCGRPGRPVSEGGESVA